ncbi:MAG: c-type cytochrome [Gemmataceae bacterium]
MIFPRHHSERVGAGWFGVVLLTLAGCAKPTEADRLAVTQPPLDFPTLYQQNCSGCHGADGKLGGAPPINDSIFLAIFSKENMRQILDQGRPGTLMPPFQPLPHFAYPQDFLPLRQLQEQKVMDHQKQIDALIEGIYGEWATPPRLPEGVTIPPYDDPAVTGNKANGAMIFLDACANCHGNQGEGTLAAGAINNPAFLALVSDQALRRIIITGRSDFKNEMPNFASTMGRSPLFQPLTSQQIADIVALMDSWRKPYYQLSAPTTTMAEKEKTNAGSGATSE